MENTFEISGRIDKMIDWLSKSRNQWKTKCIETKLHLKRQTLETKRAREGRALLKKELKEVKKRIVEIEILFEKQSQQLDELKKKSLLMKVM